MNKPTDQIETTEEQGLQMSQRLQFFLQNFKSIVELEKNLRFVLSESEIKKNSLLVLKLCEGGFLPFRDVFRLQKIFEVEKSFFQALSFIVRVEIVKMANDK